MFKMMSHKSIIIAFATVLLTSEVKAGSVIDSIKSSLGFGTNTEKIVVPAGGGNQPINMRIDVEIVRLENQAGIQASGSSCDKTDPCDTWVYATIDTEKPTAAFPGALAVKAFPNIFKSADNNNPNINVKLSKDICNQKDAKKLGGVLRVHVVDHNKLLSDSLIDDFDCAVGGTAANNANSANWADCKCEGKKQPKKIRLFARCRLYLVPASDCSNARPAPEPVVANPKLSGREHA